MASHQAATGEVRYEIQSENKDFGAIWRPLTKSESGCTLSKYVDALYWIRPNYSFLLFHVALSPSAIAPSSKCGVAQN